jgi:hypothetical protein
VVVAESVELAYGLRATELGFVVVVVIILLLLCMCSTCGIVSFLWFGVWLAYIFLLERYHPAWRSAIPVIRVLTFTEFLDINQTPVSYLEHHLLSCFSF